MSSSTDRVFEGVFAINKPSSISSAQVIRDAQRAFQDSSLFAPWFEHEQARRKAESHNQRQKRRSWKQRQPLQVKIGHGGTLDPLATGVLILGVGSGTKALPQFLECTKSYETIVLLGAETDSYDAVGKVVKMAPYEHVSREAVEEALSKFRGKIMQRPPVYSALRVQGKRLYEYAREGKEVPVEIQERAVEVEKLELVEWMDGGSHKYQWPVEKVAKEANEEEGRSEPAAKRIKNISATDEVEANPKVADEHRGGPETIEPQCNEPDAEELPAETPDLSPCPAPAVRLRMTVTSGFYVRSLAHDLGLAVGSAGLLASLMRTRQGDFELGKNVLEYEDLESGEEVWGVKVESMLDDWARRKNAGQAVEGGEK